jgi:hypothetical protein
VETRVVAAKILAAAEILAAKTVHVRAHAAAAKNLPAMTMPKKCSPLPIVHGWKS